MNTADINQARERVINQVLDATTLPEVEAARSILREWMASHPEEQGMRDGFEQLSLMQDIAESEETQNAHGERGTVAP